MDDERMPEIKWKDTVDRFEKYALPSVI